MKKAYSRLLLISIISVLSLSTITYVYADDVPVKDDTIPDAPVSEETSTGETTSTETPDEPATEDETSMVETKTTSTEAIILEGDTTSDTTSTSTSELVIEDTTEEIITETLATTTIHLQLETFDATLYDDDFIVTACPDTENGSENTINIWCAIEQLGVQQRWNVTATWGSYGVTYDIDQYKGNDFSDGMWWGWYSELSPGMTGVQAHELSQNENILLTYGIEPSKMIVSETKPELNSTTTIEFQTFDWGVYDWIPNASSTFVINDEVYFDADGIYYLDITTSSAYSVYAQKDGYITSETIIITPIATATSEIEDTNNTNTENSGGSSTPTTDNTTYYLVSDETIQHTIDALLAYFTSLQDETGQIVDGPTSDWIVMSFAATDIYGQDVSEHDKSLADYMETYDLSDPAMELNICATYPRHYLALRATGLEDSSMIDRISAECLNDDIYGQPGINDDVFGLFALLASGTPTNDELIQIIISTILEDQTNDGAFTWAGYASPDITGAVINALTYAEQKGVAIDASVYSDAISYLKSQQLADGGWGFGTSDVLTTGWTMMGLNARNEVQEDWMTEKHKNPWHVMTDSLNSEGYYASSWAPGTIDWFATKHAVPALAGSSWPMILNTVGNTITPPPGSSSGSYNPTPETTPTTTLDMTTTTTDIVTTTIDMDIVTSTQDIILEEITTSTSTASTHLDPIDLWLIEQEKLAKKNAIPSVPTEVRGAKIEKIILTPLPNGGQADSNSLTPPMDEEIKTDDEETNMTDETKPVQTGHAPSPSTEKTTTSSTQKSIIDKKDIRNTIITIVVLGIGYLALKFFKILI